MASLSEQIIDAVNDVTGRHEETRALHAKGTLCAGRFTATPEAAKLSRAPHLQGAQLRAHVRFSNGSGKPDNHDGANDGRGMAVKLYLPDGSTTDIVCVTPRQFVVRTPEDFLEFMLARRPDPETGKPDMEKLGAFLGAHPESVPAVQAQLGVKPPVSYAQLEYNSLHAFRLLDADGEGPWVRLRWVPEAGTDAHPDEDATRDLDRDYLRHELTERLSLGQGIVAFALTAAIAQDGDPLDDSTLAWPEERERVTLGRLAVTGLADDRERDGDVLVFDPTRVPDGVELSGDPILHARPGAYAESVLRRSGVARDA